MNLGLVNEITKDQMKTDFPSLRPGQTVRVDVSIKEGDKSRIQAYEGVVTKVQGSGIGKTFTVRKAEQRLFIIPKASFNANAMDEMPINSLWS